MIEVDVFEYLAVIVHTVFLSANVIFLLYSIDTVPWVGLVSVFLIIVIILITFIPERNSTSEKRVDLKMNGLSIVAYNTFYLLLFVASLEGLSSFFLAIWYLSLGMTSITFAGTLGESFARFI